MGSGADNMGFGLDSLTPEQWDDMSRRHFAGKYRPGQVFPVDDPSKIIQVEPPSALDVQVGGDHYKKLKIQPMEYSMANGLDACQHTIIKYVTRFRDKGGIADLEKAKHCIDMLIEFEKKAQP